MNRNKADDIPVRVYMAGSMRSGDGWRQLGVTAQKRGGDANNEATPETWREARHDFMRFSAGGIGRNFTYCGPFATSCDHGCAHGEAHLALACSGGSRASLLAACVDGIDFCDIFAAYIDRQNLFGTFAEIGMAKALGKKIWLGVDPEVLEFRAIGWGQEEATIKRHDHDMWFLCEMADRIEYCEKQFASTRFFNWAAWQKIDRGIPCPW